MSPPYNDPAPVSQWLWETETGSHKDDLVRVDSPFDSRHAMPVPHLTAPRTERTTSQGPCLLPEATRGPDHHSTTLQGPTPHSGRQSKGSEPGGGVRFFVVTHPDKLRDKSEMRKNRQHVMHDYLEKERMKPSSNDLRVNGAGQGRKRKRIDAKPAGTSSNPAAPTNIFRQDLARITPAASDHNTAGSEGHLDSGDATEPTIGAAVTGDDGHRANVSRALARQRTSARVDDRAPLVTGISGRFRNYTYLGTAPEEVPFTPSRLGSSLNAFDTWPTFSDPSVNVNELKWSCSRRFGSRGIAHNWVPILLKARHTFLSTICISSAHDDIMRRSSLPPDRRPQTESVQRVTVRQEVTSMINQSISDPQMQTADATLVAVLQLLNAELMGSDDHVMHVHQNGLHAMIRQRGGLGALGVGGELASITTCTMYIIAILRESLPHADFVRYAQMQETRLPKNSRSLPESPVYCRPTGYNTITKVLAKDNSIFELLEVGRNLTNTFIERHGSSNRSARSTDQMGYLVRLDDKLHRIAQYIMTPRPAMELDFRTMPERYTYEAIRLTCLLYSQALAKRVPFSEAAAQRNTPNKGINANQDMPTQAPAVHVRIRNALMKTDTTDCWGHMAGVLFWIALVAGAAANPTAAPSGYADGNEPGIRAEEQAAGEWFAAIVVRCSIVMGFEFGPSIMETLKRMVGIQQVLRQGSTPTDCANERISSWPVGVARCYGPELPPPTQQVQKGFADFAHDSMGR
ncbi:hypothetical protein LTR85_003375 [Meristemomyces frigidus]|nr:hypothetical protein LTR85_003375 [Meristemomyces frigidus]